MEQNIQQSTNQNMSPISPRNIWTPKVVALIACLVIIIGAVTYGAIWYMQKNQETPNNLPNTENNYPVNQGTLPLKEGTYFIPPAPETSNEYNAPIPNKIVQWSGDLKKVADLKLFIGYYDPFNQRTLENTDIPQVEYYIMGTNKQNQIIMVMAPAIEMGTSVFFFEKTIDDKYIFMSKMSSYGIYSNNNSAGYVLSSMVSSADTITYYNGIVGPVNLIWKGLALEQKYLSPSGPFSSYFEQQKTIDTLSIKKLDSLTEGDLYLSQQTYYPSGTNQPDTNQKFYVKRYTLKLPSGLFTTYNSRYVFFSDNSVPNITWLDGTKNQDTYRMEASLGGCGNPGAYVVSASDVSGLVKVSGTTSDGQSIYEFKDPNHPTEKFFYDLIEGKIYDYNTNTFASIPYQEWASHHPVVFYKNAIGEYAIFTNNKYGIAAECGKPVIYLYPTKPTHVTVKVGADITVSEPEYKNGWQVQANPNGMLINSDGKNYDSLFWEGIGHGMYPSVTEGFVVAQSQVKDVLSLQLKELGLNEKESADFLEFWLPKMPTTPYVRLTWFTGKQLDELAPLVIWPKPNTIIRIFLDFQGLENKISLPRQSLSTLPRNGFTVVEWGGLLRK